MEEDKQNPEHRSNKVRRRQAAGSSSDSSDVEGIFPRSASRVLARARRRNNRLVGDFKKMNSSKDEMKMNREEERNLYVTTVTNPSQHLDL
ncbi:uncharacterized protein LOC125883765 isoform X6 [Epinephelus fuscoguttatus]|uniref:uncharacterized protein LOC125883765 isoform X5 n=1 Tax=Epinephelus fuscoguttatus TaxID=293821 RepID=UPI0020D17865|nr:uncharacterized protein LOC125883765 isoform X5 [Epinephelus fuscoguttatus]XP_049424268.1 uncharacterized protein LOC125883765 isoform X6 [Epinephelus fuscoguttatus]